MNMTQRTTVKAKCDMYVLVVALKAFKRITKISHIGEQLDTIHSNLPLANLSCRPNN